MSQEISFHIRMPDELHQRAKFKVEKLFYIGLGTFIKLFLKSFVDQDNVGFYLGDKKFNDVLNRELKVYRIKSIRKRAKKRSQWPTTTA